MNGYNTGWKFDSWYDAPACAAATLSGEAFTRNGVSVANTALNGTDPANMFTGSTQIMTHGYNAIRLRFAVNAATGPDSIGVVAWRVYLLESDSEEDQTASFWHATPYMAFLSNAPSGVGAVTSYSATKSNLINLYGKSWAVFSNQLRVVQNPTGTGTELANDIDEQEAWANQYLYNAVGLDLKNGQATIDANTGLPGTAIINRRFSTPVYTPGMSGISQTANVSGELYINNLAGAARIVVHPVLHMPYTTIARNGTPLSGAANVSAKSVGVFYNLLQ